MARGAQWMERERREARRGPTPCQAPGAESTQMRILGNRGRGQKEGARQARWRRRLPEQEQERQKSMQEGAEEGRGRKAPPRSSWASGLERPRPSGPRRSGRPAWAELPSSPFSEPGAASSRAWSPGSPQRGRAPAFLAFPGGGVSYKGSCGSLERGARRPLLI